jgi:tubulin alpha
VDLNEFKTNLVPFPQAKFMLTSFAPVLSSAKAVRGKHTVKDLTMAAFHQRSQMVRVCVLCVYSIHALCSSARD